MKSPFNISEKKVQWDTENQYFSIIHNPQFLFNYCPTNSVQEKKLNLHMTGCMGKRVFCDTWGNFEKCTF